MSAETQWTTDDLESVKCAISEIMSGKREVAVQIGEKTIQYAAVRLPELLELRDRMIAEINITTTTNSARPPRILRRPDAAFRKDRNWQLGCQPLDQLEVWSPQLRTAHIAAHRAANRIDSSLDGGKRIRERAAIGHGESARDVDTIDHLGQSLAPRPRTRSRLQRH